MATIDPTARYSNAKARINTYLAAQTYAGSPAVVLDGQTQTTPARNKPFIRIQMEPLQEADSGNFSSSQRAFRTGMMIVVDAFVPDGGEESAYDAYLVDRIADDVGHALRLMSLDFQDYSSDPTNPIAVTDAPIRTLRPPVLSRLATADGFSRRQIRAEADWTMRHTL